MKKKSFLTLSLLAIFTLLSGVIFMPQNKSTVNADAVTATYDYSINKYNYHWQYDSELNLWSTDNIYDMDSDDNLAYYLNMTVQTGGTINLVFDFRLSTLNRGGELTAYINETNIIPNIEAKNNEQQQVTYSGVVSTGDVISINYVSNRILFLKFSKFLNPYDNLFKTLILLLKPSVTPFVYLTVNLFRIPTLQLICDLTASLYSFKLVFSALNNQFDKLDFASS